MKFQVWPAVIAALVLVVVGGLLLAYSSPVCYFEGRYRAGDCIEDSASGAFFRVLGRASNLKVGCLYQLEVVKPGSLTLESKMNFFVTNGASETSDSFPRHIGAEMVSLDSSVAHQPAACE